MLQSTEIIIGIIIISVILLIIYKKSDMELFTHPSCKSSYLITDLLEFNFKVKFYSAWRAYYTSPLTSAGIVRLTKLYNSGRQLLHRINSEHECVKKYANKFVKYGGAYASQLEKLYTDIFQPQYTLMHQNTLNNLNVIIAPTPPGQPGNLPLKYVKPIKYKTIPCNYNTGIKVIDAIFTYEQNGVTNKDFIGNSVITIQQTLTSVNDEYTCLQTAYKTLTQTMYAGNYYQNTQDTIDTYLTDYYENLIKILTDKLQQAHDALSAL